MWISVRDWWQRSFLVHVVSRWTVEIPIDLLRWLLRTRSIRCRFGAHKHESKWYRYSTFHQQYLLNCPRCGKQIKDGNDL